MSASCDEFRIHHQLCDGVIKTADGSKFSIHRVIVSAFSPYLRALFTNSLNSGGPEHTEIVIEDIPTEIVRLIIEFAYNNKCELTEGNVHALIVAADRLGSDSLVSFCCEFVSRNINTSNCISNLKFARTYFCRNLELKVWQFVCDRIEEVMFSPEFSCLTAEELKELLLSDNLNVKREENVFEAICRWVQVDPCIRQEHLVSLLGCVRFGLVSSEYYMDNVKPFQYNSKESEELLKTVEELCESGEDCYYFRPRIPNEVIFAIGGWSAGTPTDVIETYDKRSDSWYFFNNSNRKTRAYHGAISMNNLIYVIGGYDGTKYFSTMHCFDPITSTWSEKACMHEVRCYVSVSVLGGEIYAIGGYNGRTRLKTVEKYNPTSNQWTEIASLNQQRSDASAAALNGKLFVAGGFNGQEVLRSVEVYSPTLNQWTYVDSMTTPRSGLCLIAHSQYLYALGGFNGVDRLSSTERYNSNYNKWDTKADMLCSRSNMSGVIIDNCIFVIGGFNGSSTIPYSEYYDDADDVWYEAASMNINRSALSACVCKDLPNTKSFTYLGVSYP